MQRADLSTLKKIISEVAKKSAVAGGVTDIVLEADKDTDGGDFLRVILKIKSLERVSRSDLAALTESIEDASAMSMSDFRACASPKLRNGALRRGVARDRSTSSRA